MSDLLLTDIRVYMKCGHSVSAF